MSNYSLIGSLSRSLDELYQACSTVRYAHPGTADAALRDRIYAAQRSIERIEKSAKKLIPGGFQPARNLREEDKRAQREELATRGGGA